MNKNNYSCYMFRITHEGTPDFFNRPRVWTDVLQNRGYFIFIMGSDITIMNAFDKLKGKYNEKNGNSDVYKLDTFAGGSFIISPDRTNAEIIINGSGVPVLSWSKGSLKKINKNLFSLAERNILK
jgi:hypothetical protein